MLISYALLIFALTSSVVAPPPPPPPPPQQASSSEPGWWQILQNNADPRLLEVKGPDDVIYRWHRLKTVVHREDYPAWPEDEGLDDVMEFIPADNRIESVSYLKLRRVTQDQHYHLQRDKGYDKLRTSHLNDPDIPLVGHWGRAGGFNDAASPLAVPYDKVIEIKESRSGKELERKIHFLEREEITSHATFFPALMVYELTKGKSTPPPEPASG
ncbi:hypothetical protein AX14_000910 [Amanita brunnescens Koide BX004]|nr:hypothetical protein AX14_000910 [Amanita brunnescens Koide BX004]